MSQPTTIVIFGATGDLTARKLSPALLNLYRKGRLPESLNIIGVARRPLSDEAFRAYLTEHIQEVSPPGFDAALWKKFVKLWHYTAADFSRPEDFAALPEAFDRIDQGQATRLYYLATGPNFFQPIIQNLGQNKLARPSSKAPQDAGCRIVIEKPFGRDLASAQALNAAAHQVFQESQIYRIDHYLGKETAQNILFLRFANSIFEPLWNRNYINNVQISVTETVDVEERAEYYDEAGVLRDMFQNHLLQLLNLTALEPPSSFDADDLRNEKVKVLKAVRPIDMKDVVVGQYQGYCDLPAVKRGSRTPTYAALRLYINNWRWMGVPFYLRSGKALKHKVSQITIEFKCPPKVMFAGVYDQDFKPNILTLRIQPDEGVRLSFEVKQPDTFQNTTEAVMDFNYRDLFNKESLPEAYERLLLDAIKGDASLFSRHDEIEQAWRLIDPVISRVEAGKGVRVYRYERGSWGPKQADKLMEQDGRSWRLCCTDD